MRKNLLNLSLKKKSDIEEMFAKEKEKTQEFLDKEIESLKKLMEQKFSVARAGIFFLQASSSYEQKVYALAASNFAHSARKYFEGNSERTGQRAIRRLINDCLGELNEADFEAIPELDEQIDSLVDKLSELNEFGRFRNDIDKIKTGVAKAKKKKFEVK